MTTHEDSARSEVTHRQISATVKWFNTAKGFGFVQPSDGSADAFLHISVIERSGLRHVPEGATIVCDLRAGAKGPQVAEIHRVDYPPEAPQRGGQGDGVPIEGTVKFYNAEKGFGFVIPDSGGQDVFVSARVLERSGMHSLGPDQRVRIVARPGQKGPAAESIEAI